MLQPRPLLQNSVQGALTHIHFWPMWTDKLETHCVHWHCVHALTGSLCELCCASLSCPVLPNSSSAQHSLCHWIKGCSNADMASLSDPNPSAHLHINHRTHRLSLQQLWQLRLDDTSRRDDNATGQARSPATSTLMEPWPELPISAVKPPIDYI